MEVILETLLFSHMAPPSQGRGNISFPSLSTRSTVYLSPGNVTVVVFYMEENFTAPLRFMLSPSISAT